MHLHLLRLQNREKAAKTTAMLTCQRVRLGELRPVRPTMGMVALMLMLMLMPTMGRMRMPARRTVLPKLAVVLLDRCPSLVGTRTFVSRTTMVLHSPLQ